jgi:hypothetical protein
VATPNYGYEKRQKELAKKRKKDEKLKNRAERGGVDQDVSETPDADSPNVPKDTLEPLN